MVQESPHTLTSAQPIQRLLSLLEPSPNLCDLHTCITEESQGHAQLSVVQTSIKNPTKVTFLDSDTN